MKLDERKFMILQAIIDDYIMTAVPVGSRTISRKAGVGFSPATIRNEMSDLEELGYLDQPHTSAGRVPSPKAYRLYVDHLLKVNEVSREDAQRISSYLNSRAGQVEQVMQSAAQVLSDITHYTAVVAAPQLETLRIRRVQLVPISENTALMSQVRSRFADMFRDLKENRKLLAGVLDVLENRIAQRESQQMVVGGTTNLLSYPEYSDVEKARSFLSVLECKEKLYPLLRQAGSVEFSIRIGPENDLPELSECSILTATYRVGGHSTGTMGIIGPTRMNYGKVMSVLSYMGKAITDMLSEK